MRTKLGMSEYYKRHRWVYATLGKAKVCENCETTTAKRYDWANISGGYKKKEDDWVSLCRRCHTFYDGNDHKITIRAKRKWLAKKFCKHGHNLRQVGYWERKSGRCCKQCCRDNQNSYMARRRQKLA